MIYSVYCVSGSVCVCFSCDVLGFIGVLCWSSLPMYVMVAYIYLYEVVEL